MAVEDQDLLFMTRLMTDDSKFCAGWVGWGAWSEVGSLFGVTKLTVGSLLLTVSVMMEVA